MNRLVSMVLAVFASVFFQGILPSYGQEASARILPFIPTVRAYGGLGFHDFQRETMKEMGLDYVQWDTDFTWDFIERGDDKWKWISADEQMDAFAKAGLKVIPFLMCPKSPGLPWDETITRKSPRFRSEYGEFAYEVVNRYKNHPAWSGIVAVWGGSADVWDLNYSATYPEVVIPILNAAYDGIKRANPNTIVIGFNFATTANTPKEWEEYHRRAFAMKPKFDWYGVQSHGVPATFLEGPGAYAGVVGLTNVRKFLDKYGYSNKPLWMNEAGFTCGEDLGGLPEQIHAEQVVQSYIIGRTLGVNLKGWVYFQYFQKTHSFEDGADYGLMMPLDQSNPPKPRQGWLALQTLIRKTNFFDYEFESKISGEFNETIPFILKFKNPQRPASKLRVIFSPWGKPKKKPLFREITISIAPARQARLITMLGKEQTLAADKDGNIKLISTSSPVYVITKE